MTPSADRDALLFTSGVKFADAQPHGHRDGNGGVQRASSNGTVTWISRPTWAGADLAPGTAGLTGLKFIAVGGSEDLSTVYFMTRQTLTPADETDPPGGRVWDQSWALYKVKDGVLSNAGTLPDGTVDPAGSMSAGADVPANTHTGNLSATLGNGNVVSRNGARALFLDLGNRSVPSRVPQLYLHRDGQPSLLISKRPLDLNPVEGTTGIAPVGQYSQSDNPNSGTNTFLSATGDRDLRVILFATRDALVPGAPDDGTHVNTYRYEVEANQLRYLAELDRPGTASSRGQAGNVYRMSDDGSRILFRTPTGELRLWRAEQSTVTLASGIGVMNATSNGITGVRFSEDARTVVFMSRQPIAGEATHPPGNGVLQTQVYRFDEDVDTVPRCVSCPALDAVVKGPAVFDLKSPLRNGYGTAGNDPVPVTQTRGISADGRRVFFTTTSTLDPRDQNTTTDVYEWSADRDGVALLSTGAPGSRGDALVDIDAEGKDVFFVTEARLTASDIDDIYDMYTARRGGGLPDPPGFDGESICPLDGGCQGQGSTLPALPSIGSVSFSGDGNIRSLPNPVGPSVVLKRVRSVTGPAARLRVRVPGAGRVSVRGSLVRRAGRSVSRAGVYSVRVTLTPRARKSLAKRKRLKANVRVSFRAQDGRSAAKSVAVAFRQANSKRDDAKKKGAR